MNIEDRLVDAYLYKAPSELSPDKGRVSLTDFLTLWCVDGRDIDKHQYVTVFCSKEDYLDTVGDEKPEDVEDGRTTVIALASRKLLLIVAVPTILKDGEVVLMGGDEQTFSKKLVLN